MLFHWFHEKKKEPRQVGQVILQHLVDELRRRQARIVELEAELERLSNANSK